MTFALPPDTTSLTREDLRRLTEELTATVRKMLRRCVDADVTFPPQDAKASDPQAAPTEEQNVAWTLGHIIVHMTASGEETAALAAELARGVSNHGRSRYEVPWESVSTVVECRARLQESCLMRTASLNMWPDQPHVQSTYSPFPGMPEMSPIEYFCLGLQHDASHLDHLRDVIAQARAYRKQQTLLGRWRAARRAHRAAPSAAA